MAANDAITNTVPSLLKSAYKACSKIQQKWYDDHIAPDVFSQICCKSLFKILKLNTKIGFNPFSDKLTMFHKVSHVLNDRIIYEIYEHAAFHGHVDCMAFAREIGVPWTNSREIIWENAACAKAAISGNLECLIYAHVNGCEWVEDTCYWAAANGHLDCLRYAHENGCPWTVNTCHKAAKNGHLNCLIYAHTNGCPIDNITYRDAVDNGYLDCVRYLNENGCPRGFI